MSDRDPAGDGTEGAEAGDGDQAEGFPFEATSSQWEQGVSTGLEILDRRLGGGLRPGSVVALVGDPDSPTEELCYPAAAANPTRYLSLLRPASEVARHAARRSFEGLSVTDTTAASLLDDPAGSLSGLDPESLVVLDPATELEREGRERYLSFFETLKRAVETTESVALLHCPRMNPRALQRDLTLARADTVLELVGERGSAGGHAPATRWSLCCSKNRLGRLPETGLRVGFGPDGPAIVTTGER